MGSESERGPEIIDAYQDLVRHIEQGATRMRVLSTLTSIVAAVLAVAYVSQLILPLTGTTTVSVNLTDPFNVATELAVFALAFVWLYVGIQDFRFSSKMRREILEARSKEQQVQDRIS
jgi:ABC-type nickel/cobalt efflux system permease component RcnA